MIRTFRDAIFVILQYKQLECGKKLVLLVGSEPVIFDFPSRFSHWIAIYVKFERKFPIPPINKFFISKKTFVWKLNTSWLKSLEVFWGRRGSKNLHIWASIKYFKNYNSSICITPVVLLLFISFPYYYCLLPFSIDVHLWSYKGSSLSPANIFNPLVIPASISKCGSCSGFIIRVDAVVWQMFRRHIGLCIILSISNSDKMHKSGSIVFIRINDGYWWRKSSINELYSLHRYYPSGIHVIWVTCKISRRGQILDHYSSYTTTTTNCLP